MRFEAYTAAGIVHGQLGSDGPLWPLLEASEVVAIPSGRLMRIDGGDDVVLGGEAIGIDDLLLVVAPDDLSAPVHATWHELALAVGPYEIRGEMPTLPGFDPGRALARPSGTFVLLRSVRVSLLDHAETGANEYHFAWVNRYTVERVAADLDLALFFPGAEETLTATGGEAQLAPK